MRVALVLIAVMLSGCFGGITDLGDSATAPDGGAPAPDPKAAFRQWSGCMTMTNFQAANMKTAWSTLTTNDGKQCLNCHDGGQFNFIASDDEAAYFTGLSEHSYFLAVYFRVDPATKKVEINTQGFASANSKVGHPKFNPTANQGITALTAFHAATAANTACESAKMLD